jgi:hypothetical protein
MDRAALFKGIEPSLVAQILATCKLADQGEYSEAQSQQVLKEIERLNAVKTEAKKKDSPASPQPTNKSTESAKAGKESPPPNAGVKSSDTAITDEVVASGAVVVRDAVFAQVSDTIDEEMGSLAELDAPMVRKMMVTSYMSKLAKAMRELPPLTTAEIIDVDAVRQHLVQSQQNRLPLAGGQAGQLPPGKSS